MLEERPASSSWRKRPGVPAEFARFLIAGTVNTLIGYGVILLALQFVGYQLAYALGYAVGIVVAYVTNSRFVFRKALSLRTALRYPIVYALQYMAGALVLQGLVKWLGMDARWAALIALAVSVPVTFVLNRIALAARKSSDQ
jgi:putative flippase GtrA